MTGKMIKGTSFTLDMMRALKEFLAVRDPHPRYPNMPKAIVVVHANQFRHYITGMGRALDINMAHVVIVSSRGLHERQPYRGLLGFGLFVDHAVWECSPPYGLHAELEAARMRADYVYQGRPFNAAEAKS